MCIGYLPKEKGIFPPENGWEDSTYYKVGCSFDSHNPIHMAILYTGFLDKGNPGSYSKVWNPIWGQVEHVKDIYFIKAIEKLNQLTK